MTGLHVFKFVTEQP